MKQIFLLRNVYLSKKERIEIDFKLQEIGVSLFHNSFWETAFTALVMRFRRTEAQSVFGENALDMLNNIPKTAQPAPPGLVPTSPIATFLFRLKYFPKNN
jgi:hypothetical protein